MGGKGSSKEVVVVPMDRGYAVVTRSDWDELVETARLADTIIACTTWGEYRALGTHRFEDLIDDEDHDDDEPFTPDLPFDDGNEGGFDRYGQLESGTYDFFESLDSATVFDSWIEEVGPWKWVKLDCVEKVKAALVAQGFAVIEMDFDKRKD